MPDPPIQAVKQESRPATKRRPPPPKVPHFTMDLFFVVALFLPALFSVMSASAVVFAVSLGLAVLFRLTLQLTHCGGGGGTAVGV
jgi:protein-S-isoprenylcysteine O-methyltransferase Ste14